jgi:transposase
MKTVSKINPEKEYEQAKKLIELASQKMLQKDDLSNLDSSVDNLMTAARVLMEREERRRGAPKPPPSNTPKGRKAGDSRADSNKLPSQKYLDLIINEEIIRPETPPECPCCHKEMKESGLFDTSEKLEVIPKQYFIQKIKRVKFNCSSCHGAMVNTPAVPSIVPTSNYGDSLIIDVALSKYCSLIPMERYAQMAYQAGLGGDLPAQSLIGLTHHFANFLQVIYLKIKDEVLASLVLQADESPHKMLEGDETRNWYLWGFFSPIACYFEAHGTRSGDKALDFLKLSNAIVIMTDGYQGYAKATRLLKESDGRIIQEAHCNAHAFRYFKEAGITWKEECEVFLRLYGEIYELERERKKLDKNIGVQIHLEFRQKMIPLFAQLKSECDKKSQNVMSKSQLEKSINYFLNHYDGLTLCTQNIDIPLDNNLAERELRAHVVGRKTWYGTHSKRGALTASVLFSIVQSCKLNSVNPYNYFPWVVQCIHRGERVLTPYEYSKIN